MKTRSFLKPLAAVFAVLASATAFGSSREATPPTPAPLVPDASATVGNNASGAPIQANESRGVLVRQGQDIFKFTLWRNKIGQFFAQHESHASHSSHSSHRSHYSSN